MVESVLGARIRKLRQGRGMVLAELSQKVGVSITALSEFERGRKRPALDTLERIAAALGVDAGLLVSDPALKSEAEEIMGQAFLRAQCLDEQGRAAVVDYIEFTLAKQRQGKK